MSQRPSLDEIGRKHRTDKSSGQHGYLGFYEAHFAAQRDEPIRLLEIGVFNGASLKTWEEYFPRARIVGVDINPSCKQFESERVAIEVGDQSNIEDITRVAVKYGPFDVVIEDGSHLWEHQITSLRTLFPFVKENGYYAVEDLQTNFGPMQEKYRGIASVSCMDFLKRWLDLKVADDTIELGEIEDAFLRTYGRAVHFMSFYRRACLLRKSHAGARTRTQKTVALAPGLPNARSLPVNLLVHVGLRGDVVGSHGVVDLGSDAYTFQGLAVDCENSAVEYRVRFPDQSWSEWAHGGAFAGTRGRSLALTGFCARFREGADAHYALRAFGRFVGREAIVEAADGEDCVSPAGEPLRGVQIDLSRRAG